MDPSGSERCRTTSATTARRRRSNRDSGAYYRIAPDGAVKRLTPRILWHHQYDGVVAGRPLRRSRYDQERALCLRLSARRPKHIEPALTFRSASRADFRTARVATPRGTLWNCRVAGGACLARFAPDGRVDRVVELPCTWPTSCTFGGPGLTTLFVTSARFTMTAEHLEKNPQEGGLFALDVGIAGVPEFEFAG